MEEKNANPEAPEKKDNSETDTDAFGQPLKEEAPKEDVKGEENKDKDGKKEEKNDEAISELKSQIEEIKRDYGENLAGQRELIKTLKDKISELQGGKKEETDVLHKEIKYSKDLTAEEREDMTETEIKQMDEIAALKEAQNKMYSDIMKGQKKEKEGEEKKVEDLQSFVKDEAKRLAKEAGGNTELANEIIESAKQFKLEGLTEEEVKERVKAAAKLLPNYKPPKEKPGMGQKPVKGKGASEDPFGVDKIVEEATKGQDGGYNL
jgi:hypothetical protein